MYFWAWPLVNIYNRRLAFSQVKEMLYLGPLPQAPVNRFAMLTDYIVPEERAVACPNQDVVYGNGFFSLDVEPVVIQVPDFGARFWVYALYDGRTDQFGRLGKPYKTKPCFYLLAGPNWRGAARPADALQTAAVDGSRARDSAQRCRQGKGNAAARQITRHGTS